MPSDIVEGYLMVREDLIGPIEECLLEAPSKINGQYVKGVHFEHCIQSKELKDSQNRKRVYAITQSQQRQNGILGPNVEAKLYDQDAEGNDIKIRKELADVLYFT